MKVRIDVTAEDIRYGLRMEGESCPVALAFARVKPAKLADLRSHFTAHHLKFFRDAVEHWTLSYDLPPEAKAFIAAFDRDQPVSPISFDLEIPEATSGN